MELKDWDGLRAKDFKRGGRQRHEFLPEVKTLILKIAIQEEFSSKNLPLPHTLVSIFRAIEPPLNRGRAVIKARLEHVVDWIIQNVNDRKTCGLIHEKLICREGGKGQHRIRISLALKELSYSSDFSYLDVAPSGRALSKHAGLGHTFVDVANSSMLGHKELIHSAMNILAGNGFVASALRPRLSVPEVHPIHHELARQSITPLDQPSSSLGPRTTYAAAVHHRGRRNTAQAPDAPGRQPPFGPVLAANSSSRSGLSSMESHNGSSLNTGDIRRLPAAASVPRTINTSESPQSGSVYSSIVPSPMEYPHLPNSPTAQYPFHRPALTGSSIHGRLNSGYSRAFPTEYLSPTAITVSESERSQSYSGSILDSPNEALPASKLLPAAQHKIPHLGPTESIIRGRLSSGDTRSLLAEYRPPTAMTVSESERSQSHSGSILDCRNETIQGSELLAAPRYTDVDLRPRKESSRGNSNDEVARPSPTQLQVPMTTSISTFKQTWSHPGSIIDSPNQTLHWQEIPAAQYTDGRPPPTKESNHGSSSAEFAPKLTAPLTIGTPVAVNTTEINNFRPYSESITQNLDQSLPKPLSPTNVQQSPTARSQATNNTLSSTSGRVTSPSEPDSPLELREWHSPTASDQLSISTFGEEDGDQEELYTMNDWEQHIAFLQILKDFYAALEQAYHTDTQFPEQFYEFLDWNDGLVYNFGGQKDYMEYLNDMEL